MQFYNIHTHRRSMIGVTGIRNAFTVPMTQSKYFFSSGIHPWYIESNHCYLNSLEQLKLNVKLKNCLAVGEFGLDKLKGPSMLTQINCFKNQLEIAHAFKKPVILHTVRAYQETYGLIKDCTVPVIMHDFKANIHLFKQFLELPFVYFSFGLRMAKQPDTVKEIYNYLPIDRLFFETDNKNISIEKLYNVFAELFGAEVNSLLVQTETNFKKVFS